MNQVGMGRSVLLGAILGVMAVSAAVAAFVLLVDPGQTRRGDANSVVMVVTGPGAEEAAVAYAICVLDTTKGRVSVRAVDPDIAVVVPGTSYETLHDAYPFGGAVAVREGLARVDGSDEKPYLEVGPAGLGRLLAGRGLPVRIDSRMDVFTGSELVTFEPGERSLSASETYALGQAAQFLSRAERSAQRERLGVALAQALADRAEDLPLMVQRGEAKTDLSEEALRVFAERLRDKSLSTVED